MASQVRYESCRARASNLLNELYYIPDKTSQLLTEILGRPGAMIRHSGRACRDESYLLLRVTQQELEALITDKAEKPHSLH